MDEIKNPDSFIFYRSFLEAIEEADDKCQLQLYRAISLYALNREEPQLKGMVKAVWMVIKPQIDANYMRYVNGSKGASHGKKGGAPKGNANARKQPQNNPKTTPNVNVNVNENENEKGECETPTLEIIMDYISQHNLAVNGEKFYYHYQSNGWHGVHDWKSKLKKWHLTDQSNQQDDKSSRRRGTEPGTKSRKGFKGTF